MHPILRPGIYIPPAVRKAGNYRGWAVRNQKGLRVPKSSLTKATSAVINAMSGWSWDSALGIVSVNSGSPVPLERIDTNGVPVTVKHSGRVLRDCYFWNDTVTAITGGSQRWGAVLGNNNSDVVTDTLFEYCEFDGKAVPGVRFSHGIVTAIQERAGAAAANIHSTTIRGCYIHHCGSDGVNLFGSNSLVELSYFGIGGWTNKGTAADPADNRAAHYDGCQLVADRGPAIKSIARWNYFEDTPDPQQFGTFGRTGDFALSGLPNGADIYENACSIGGDVLDNGYNESLGTWGSGQYFLFPFRCSSATNAGIRVWGNTFLLGPGCSVNYTVRKGVSLWDRNYDFKNASLDPADGLLTWGGNN